ncbi:60S ribosomal protein L7-2, putative [Plasmodium reichenowi]|uniref:60S ribosomal protein L7-2, putative n=14 Tax=Plasmodium (Laverania) TaxID=418107 RepID=C0H5I4_PLAF7|nr:60S ribosomal protein L7-2, putative [Plasmodium falciparum 3D7]XP_012764913.1 60S ribosomal protein L7-2, putative [Plasmodium reichenowi]ETW16576.1 hypothetical protein PFFVO_04436 [Plasmodium falciparum Vietnam Oak-Knoll (FVO)]ETW40696.1 hypothetical protein PFNF135_04999 [Plasmodium falciparum NF135/5.C10]ETW47320.1 hypothetical protein PFMALIP_04668 [Plasmodium falciparum MaliPS096_E11]ETW55699.1 hypothetical protein PFUGPA_02461 [Plasmodium falciparum Palo Alto/Uganda]ETW59306.1 hypo|eukprot:XP_002809081.1 60S ribosomal protein L7-2, putative [Plasmodium falciparum 3D7]
MDKKKSKKEPIKKKEYNKVKHVKFRRIKKINFKEEKIRTDKRKINIEKIRKRQKKFDTLYKKKEYTKKLNGQKNEYMNLKNELVNEKFDTERQCVFIIRNDVDCIHNESKLLLKELKLINKYDGIILINTEENMKKLYVIKPYICYGYIKKYNFYNLMEKRLYIRDQDQIKRCDSNKMIEQIFSKEGIYSFRSFCDYIFECKDNADIITKNYIYPFDFSFLNTKITFDFLQFKQDFKGFLKNEINEILEKII